MKELAKKLAGIFFGDYAIYHIYSSSPDELSASGAGAKNNFTVKPVDQGTINSCGETQIREQGGYAGAGSHAYACFDGDHIVGVCFYWFGDRYLKRNFWPLTAGEAKLVQIIVLPEMRGRGVATTLIESSCRDLLAKGFNRAYARIWHSNTPSLMAFERAHWMRIGTVVELNPFRLKTPIRMRFGAK